MGIPPITKKNQFSSFEQWISPYSINFLSILCISIALLWLTLKNFELDTV